MTISPWRVWMKGLGTQERSPSFYLGQSRGGLPEEVTFELGPEGSEGANQVEGPACRQETRFAKLIIVFGKG